MSSIADLEDPSDNLTATTEALTGHDIRLSHEAKAQKGVAQALLLRNFEQAILIASAALENMGASKGHGSEAKRKMLWARASAYTARKLPKLALADARKALKLSPDDPEAYARTAKILIDSDHHDQASQCLDIADEKLKHGAPSDRIVAAMAVERQRRRLREACSVCHISRLPEEILLHVFKYITSVNAASLVCRTWRRIILSAPPIWRRLVLRQGLSETQCIDALSAYTWRSNSSIESAELPASLFWCNPRALLSILRKSAATLRHVKMPSHLQRTCYEELYRHCVNLKVLDVDVGNNIIPKKPNDLSSDTNDDWPKEGVSPFQLEIFRGSNQSCGFPPFSMQELRILRYRDHDDPVFAMQTFRDIVEVADTLEELANFNPRLLASNIHTFREAEASTQDASRPITFKMLKTLQGWNIPRHSKRFTFPALEEATRISCSSAGNGPWPYRPVSTFFTDSPLIRTLDLDLTEIAADDVALLLISISRLQLLEDLSLTERQVSGVYKAARLEHALAPKYQWNAESRKYLPHIPCLRLERLSIVQEHPSVSSLILVLAMRNYLALGHPFKVAQDLTQKHFGLPSVPRPSRTTPFQRGPVTVEQSASDSIMPITSDAGCMQFSVSRLRSIELTLVSMPDGALEQLEKLADRAKISYQEL